MPPQPVLPPIGNDSGDADANAAAVEQPIDASKSKPTQVDTEDQHKDGWRAWSVVFCAAIVMAHTPGMHYIYGVMFVTLLETFEEPRGVTVCVAR